MFNAQGKLDIFERFRIDYGLPKHRRKEEQQGGIKMLRSPTQSEDAESDEEEDGEEYVEEARSGNFVITTSANSLMLNPSTRRHRERRWYDRIVSLFRRKPKEPKPTITIEQFFASIKNSAKELEIVEARAAGYKSAMLKAKAGGQEALYEKMEKALVAVRGEAQLVAMGAADPPAGLPYRAWTPESGIGKYLEEAQVVEFVKKARKGLRLDWVANFTRVIPDELLTRKKAADERKIFDNYVVLHYDPQMKSWAETEAEKQARRRDPILFGVIDGRRRLYYLGDWIDEFCDLTFDEIADTLGKGAVGSLAGAKP